jgi:hypothetical protein
MDEHNATGTVAGSVFFPQVAPIGSKPASSPTLCAQQPRTWPEPPRKIDDQFIQTLRTIFNDSMLGEIDNVIADAQARNGDLQRRGHVVVIALLCALDAVSFYGYGEERIPDFVRAHFPSAYHPYADDLWNLYRHIMVHHWNLFHASLCPGNDPITKQDGVISFGVLHFWHALHAAVEDFLEQLKAEQNAALRSNTVKGYTAMWDQGQKVGRITGCSP